LALYQWTNQGVGQLPKKDPKASGIKASLQSVEVLKQENSFAREESFIEV